MAASLVQLMAGSALAAGNTLKVDAAATTVAKDATFTVKIVTTSAGAIGGAQMTLTFDKAKVQVTKVARGTPFASSPLFLGAEPAAIAAANKNGKLKGIAAAFFPPASAPAGAQEFLVIEMKAIGCGESKLGLPVGASDAQLLDGRDATYGDPLKTTATGGTVTVACDGTAGSPAAPGGPVDPLASPLASGDVLGASAAPDPLASADPNAIPGASAPTDGSASPAAPATSPGLNVVPVSSSTNLFGGNQWLDFALAALAVAAAGLALLIVIIVLAILIAGFVGLFWLIRTMRRPADGTTPPSPESETPAADAEDASDEEPEYDPLAAEAEAGAPDGAAAEPAGGVAAGSQPAGGQGAPDPAAGR